MIIMFRIQLCRNGDDTMELEMDVEDLLNKRKLESDRIEFKAGWNPDDIYHSVCAFANDYNNDGGGYIVVGVEEENGVAKRPVKAFDTSNRFHLMIPFESN